MTPDRSPTGQRRSAGGVPAAPAGLDEGFWMLLTGLGGVESEERAARLLVSALPRLVPCRLSGVGLAEGGEALDGAADGEGLDLVLHAGGEPVEESRARGVADALAAALAKSPGRGTFRISAGDGPADPALRSAPLDELEVESLMVAPLRTVRGLHGLLVVGRPEGEPFTRTEEFRLNRVRDHVAVAMENLRLHRSLERHSHRLEEEVERRTADLERSRRRLRILLDLSNAVFANLDREPLFRTVAATLRKEFALDRASLALHRPERGVYRVFALAGAGSDEPESPIGRGSEVPAEEYSVTPVAEEGEPRIRMDLAEDAEGPVERELLEVGIRSYVSVPLPGRDRVLGVLNLGSREPGQYDQEGARFLEAVARQVALAVENMLALEEIESRRRRAEAQTELLESELREAKKFGEIVGTSSAIRRIEERIERVAPTDATVLVQGESGTGKELVAREIHRRSERSDGPMVKVNCASIPRDLYESEFFGHVEGAFTGAVEDRVGRFEAADGGTLLLDEVGEIPLDLQSKLLRVLQEGEFQRVGEQRTRSPDVRVVAATNRDLAEAVEEGRFRSDLFYRLNVFPIEVPPLRDRKEDIPLLAEHFAVEVAEDLNVEVPELEPDALRRLRAYDWPGNVRELRNVIERALITAEGRTLSAVMLPPRTEDGEARAAPREPSDLFPEEGEILTEEEMNRLARENMKAALRAAGGQIYGSGGAAEMLGIPPSTLASRVKKQGLLEELEEG